MLRNIFYGGFVAASVVEVRERRASLFITHADAIQQSGIEAAISNTPLIKLESISKATGCEVYGKAEWLNPTGSVKDRAAKQIVAEAERSGSLKPGSTIVEGTGGNTGITLAAIAAARGYKAVICMPHFIAKERSTCARASAPKCTFSLECHSLIGKLRQEGCLFWQNAP